MSTILVVDDYPVIGRMLGVQLRRQGYQVVTALDGQEALDRLAEGPIDLVITDLSMPGMDGLELLRRLRARDRYRDLPVIMLTASGVSESAAAALSEGASDFLSKPVSSQELYEAVGRLLG